MSTNIHICNSYMLYSDLCSPSVPCDTLITVQFTCTLYSLHLYTLPVHFTCTREQYIGYLMHVRNVGLPVHFTSAHFIYVHFTHLHSDHEHFMPVHFTHKHLIHNIKKTYEYKTIKSLN